MDRSGESVCPMSVVIRERPCLCFTLSELIDVTGPKQFQPVISANMDTTGTFEMAIELSKYKMLTAIHKHYTVEEVRAHPS